MKITSIILLAFVLVACDQKTQYAIRTELDADILSVDTIEVNSIKSPPNFEYWIADDHYNYIIDFETLENPRLILNSKELLFRFDDSTSVLLNSEKLILYKFLANEAVYDGATAHYFSLKHGLLLIKSITWQAQTEILPWSHF